MEKFNLEAFQEFEVAKSSKVTGGACTGGGFQRLGDGIYASWQSDETNGGTTTYHDVKIEW